MAAILANLDRFYAEEKQLLALRSATSRRTGSLLLAIDLAEWRSCCSSRRS